MGYKEDLAKAQQDFKNAKWKTVEDYQKEAADKKAAKEYKIPKDFGMKEGEEKSWKKGGKVKKYARGGGIEVRGKTKGRIV